MWEGFMYKHARSNQLYKTIYRHDQLNYFVQIICTDMTDSTNCARFNHGRLNQWEKNLGTDMTGSTSNTSHGCNHWQKTVYTTPYTDTTDSTNCTRLYIQIKPVWQDYVHTSQTQPTAHDFIYRENRVNQSHTAMYGHARWNHIGKTLGIRMIDSTSCTRPYVQTRPIQSWRTVL